MADEVTKAIVTLSEGSMKIDQALFDTCNVLAKEVMELQTRVQELQGNSA